MRKPALVLALAVAALLQGAGPALAHKLRVFATQIGPAAEGRVYFVGGGPALGVPVTLTDASGAVLATTTTAASDGSFSIPLPAGVVGAVTITADAQDGHVAAFSLTPGGDMPAVAPEAGASSTGSSGAATGTTIGTETGMATGTATGNAAAAPAAPLRAIDPAALDIAIARQIAPLAAEIDEMNQTLRFRDILGGVGYLFGIFGLWSLMLRRKAARSGGGAA